MRGNGFSETEARPEDLEFVVKLVQEASSPPAFSESSESLRSKGSEKTSADNKATRAKVAESNLLDRLDQLFVKHHKGLIAAIQKDREEKEKKNWKKLSSLLDSKISFIQESISTSVAPTVTDSVTSKMFPAIDRQFDSLKSDLLPKVSKSQIKVTAFESPVLRSAIEAAVQNRVQHAVKTAFQSSLCPAFEQSMMEVRRQSSSYISSLPIGQENGRLQLAIKAQSEELVNLQKEISRLVELLYESSEEEKSVSLKDLLAEGKFSEAFTRVLDLGDIQVVCDVCRVTEPKLWEIIPTLSNAAVLSLVQQLSLDLSSDVQLKLNWMAACILNLKTDDPSLAPYIPRVLGQVEHNLSSFKSSFDPSQTQAASMVLAVISKYLV